MDLRHLFRRPSPADKPYYTLLKRIFGIVPENVELYKLALVHRSASVTVGDGRTVNNERLEFLGDAVIEAVVSELLFIAYPDANEGFLSKLRSRMVSRETLNRVALELGLDEAIVAHPSSLVASRNNIYGDALEALIGALYLDRGYETANRVLIDGIFSEYVDMEALEQTEKDFKSRVIEWGQKHHRTVEFRSSECADHVELAPHFETELLVGGVRMGYGDARSKKEAEQIAAREAYQSLQHTA
ncbi:ribonuclease III [uncultured Rikenella sp.]|uniref:ribonuclease III n=1 Tax=uncultured Rikenella sp. TaxID=368003 RepID=UPI002638D119|nr:ribonuclease III [uncultured Rikenella sp.]